MRKFRRKLGVRRWNGRRGRRSFKRRVATKKFVYKAINRNLEKKFRDLQFEAQISWTGNVFGGISDIFVGTTDTTRIGDKLRMKALRMRYSWEVSDTFNRCRLIVFQWTQNTASILPAVGDILENAGSSTTGVFSPYRHDTGSNYRILYDSMMHVDTDDPQKFRNVSIPLRRCKTRRISYVGGSAEGTGKLFLLVITDSSAVSHPTFKAYARLTYTDA